VGVTASGAERASECRAPALCIVRQCSTMAQHAQHALSGALAQRPCTPLGPYSPPLPTLSAFSCRVAVSERRSSTDAATTVVTLASWPARSTRSAPYSSRPVTCRHRVAWSDVEVGAARREAGRCKREHRPPAGTQPDCWSWLPHEQPTWCKVGPAGCIVGAAEQEEAQEAHDVQLEKRLHREGSGKARDV